MNACLQRWLLFVGGCLFVLTLCVATAHSDELVDRILAVVNGKIITLFDVNQQIRGVTRQFEGRVMTLEEEKGVKALRHKVLMQMVNDLLLEAEAQRLKISVSDVEIRNQINTFKQHHGITEDQFLNQLKLQGLTRKEYETTIKKDIMRQRLIGAMVRQKVAVTEDEMETYYKEHQGDFSQDKKVKLALLVVDAGFDMQGLCDRLHRGDLSFGQAVSLYSTGPNAQGGGEIGEVRWADMRDSWKEVLRGLDKGNTSEPFDVEGGQALLHIIDITPGKITPFQDVKARIRDILYKPRMEQRFQEYVGGLRAKAVVDIRL